MLAQNFRVLEIKTGVNHTPSYRSQQISGAVDKKTNDFYKYNVINARIG